MIEFCCLWCTICLFRTHQKRFCIYLNISIDFSHEYCKNHKKIIPLYPNIQYLDKYVHYCIYSRTGDEDDDDNETMKRRTCDQVVGAPEVENPI